MRKIIDGKAYDTETAERLCGIGPSGFGRNDFMWEDTDLYRTPRGRFFIAGEGGALTRWAQSVGQGGRCGGNGIRPVWIDRARALYEEHGDPGDYDRHFGEPEEA